MTKKAAAKPKKTARQVEFYSAAERNCGKCHHAMVRDGMTTFFCRNSECEQFDIKIAQEMQCADEISQEGGDA
jgi:hypothetical protein